MKYAKLKWAEGVKFLKNENKVIAVNLYRNEFVKLRMDAVNYIDTLLDNIHEAERKELNQEDSQKLHELMKFLQKNKYIVKINDSNKGIFSLKKYISTPKKAYFEISGRCNLRCSFCYANPKADSRKYLGDTEAAKQIIDKLAKLNVKLMVITGGEPLLRKDYYEIISYAKKKMKFVVLTTNGTLIDFKTAQNLKDSGLDSIQVSIESSKEEEHDRMRGKGTFAKAVSAVKYLKQAGFKNGQIIISATTTKENIGSMDSFSEFAKSLGVKHSFSFFQSVGRAYENKEKFTPNTQEQIDFFLSKMEQDLLINACSFSGNSENHQGLEPNLKNYCGMGSTTIAVKENGDIVPCHVFLSDDSFIIGNISDFDIAEKLFSFVKHMPTIDDIDGCKECNVRYFCGSGCWAQTYWQYHTFNHPHPYCDFYKKYLSAIVWNLGEENEVQKIHDALSLCSSCTSDSGC